MRKISNYYLKNKSALAALVVLCLYIAAGIFAESILFFNSDKTAPFYEKSDMAKAYRPPSAEHWMGTDYKGRDVFWRAFFAIRTALKIGILASLISSAIGLFLGAVSGYFGSFIDDLVTWLYSSFAAIPTLLFVLAFSLLATKGFMSPPFSTIFSGLASLMRVEPGMLALYLGIGLTGWVGLCRVVRGEVMKLRETAYVQAARSLGYRDIRIIFRHIVPNIMHIVIIYFTVRFAYAIATEVIVSYIGIGVQTEPSWGVMISDGQQRLWRGVWWEIGAATAFMSLLVLSIHMTGDALRDILDPR